MDQGPGPDRGVIDQLHEVWTSIGALGRSLTAGDWDRATDCPGWTVRDQLSHMIGTESMLAGRSAPPPAPEGLTHVHNPIGQMNEAWVEARRARPGPELLAEFDELTAARLAGLRAMTDEQLVTPGPSPIGTVPYAVFMDVRVMDCWVHEQDIRRAVDQPGHLEGPAVDAALRRFGSSLGFVVAKRAGAPDGTEVVVDLRGASARCFAVAVHDGRAAETEPGPEPTVRVVTDVETYACLVSGRWTAERALGEGRVSLEGDTSLGRAVIDALNILP